jgi:acyl-coenzyme A synthetase/AMP-(fatty) acid ligase
LTTDNQIAAARTFPELIRAAASAYGDDIAVIFKGETIPDDAISFAGLDTKSAELARGLLARGIGKGSRVGFISGNGPFFAIVFAAIGRIGAVAIPISTMIKSNELVRVLRQSDVAGLIVQRSFLGHDYIDRLCEALPELHSIGSAELRIGKVPYLRWIASFGESRPRSIYGMDYLTQAAQSVSEELLIEAEVEVHPTDQLIEIYTSGSMALPKGVKHNHGPTMFRAHCMRELIGIPRGKELAAALPMFWVGGLMMSLLPNWVAGATTTCTERTLNNSRMAMGSVLPAEDLAILAAHQPKPWWGLGMSETLGPYSYGTEFRAEGYPVCAPLDNFAPGYEVRIADENNQSVADGEIGELQIRGLPVTSGLHKIERCEHFTPDGYYLTGDMCLVDGKRLHFIGRSGDVIKAAGSNVSPAEVEMEMQALEGIESAYVVGLPDQERGELVVAAVVPRDGVTLDFAKLEAELKARLSSYKVPRAYVAITREEVPMLHSNKVAKRLVAELLKERLGRA